MIREEYGQMAHQTRVSCVSTLTSCSVTLAWLRSRTSLGLSMTTHLTRARWVIAARVLLPLWRTQSRPCRHPRPTPAVHSPAYLAAFARFPNKRLIAVGKFERNVKEHQSMFLKLRFHVLRCSRNGTFVRTFVNMLSFLGLRQAAQCQRPYYWCARVGVWQVRTALLPLPSAAAHTDWPRHSVARCGFSAYLIQNPISEVELIIASNR